MRLQGILALAVVALSIAACGGGGGGGSSPAGTSNAVLPTAPPNVAATPTSAALPAGYAVDKVLVTMAKGTYAASARRLQAIGTGTESIVFTLLQQNGSPVTGTPQVFGLTSSSQNCTVNAGTGNLGCTLPVDAPIGQDIFLAQTYANSDGTGGLTGSGAVALSVGQNTTNTASIVLNAQVAAVFVVAGNNVLGTENLSSVVRNRGAQALRRPADAPPTGPNSMPVFVIATDSSGNTILNPSAYNAPLYLQLAFDPNEPCCSGNATADVTLSVTYGISDPTPCTAGSTVAVNTYYASLPLCSPSDSVTAALSPTGGANPSETAFIFGYINANTLVPTPAPSQTPLPLVTPSANSFAYFSVFYPAPSPFPSGGSITVIGE
jgi:hypothetical protein